MTDPHDPAIPIEPTTTPSAPAGWDGQAFEPARARAALGAAREEARMARTDRTRMANALRELGVDVSKLPPATHAPDTDAIPAYEQTLRDVGRLLGLTDEAIAAPAGRDALVAAARKSRLAESLSEAITRANVDPGLARAVVDLADVDVTGDADSVAGALDAAVADAIKRHPAIKRPTFAARSISEFPAGSGGSPARISREALSWMSPEQINAARKAGLLTHLRVGGG